MSSLIYFFQLRSFFRSHGYKEEEQWLTKRIDFITAHEQGNEDADAGEYEVGDDNDDENDEGEGAEEDDSCNDKKDDDRDESKDKDEDNSESDEEDQDE